MNIFLRTAMFTLAFFMAGSLRLPGQTIFKDTLDVFRDAPANYSFETVLTAQITSNAKYGQVFVNSIYTASTGVRTYHLIYKPAPGFVGLDTFRYTRTVNTCISTPICTETREVLVRVKTSEVHASADLFYVPVNSGAAVLDVLRNDSGSSGKLELARISMVNNGEAVFTSDSRFVQFKPKTGFTGVAQISYTVCDTFGTCDQASVSVVVGKVQGKEEDILRIFTVRDVAVPVLVPNVYALFDTPRHGFLDLNQDIPVYTPPAGFVGKDRILFSSKDGDLPVEITVLDVTRNGFARDDQGNVTPGRKLELNVLGNDVYGAQAGCMSFTQPLYGKVYEVEGAPGLLVYEAPSWFIGIDEFSYASFAPGCKGKAETATVRIVVSNFEPAYSKFRMNTPMNTPMIISYNTPISDYKFNITQKAKRGQLSFLPGSVDTLINGVSVKGTNVLLYVPNNNATGLDAFEVAYCLAGTGSKPCRYQKNVKIEMDILPIGSGQSMCVDDCIWVGDANRDGIVNMQDILVVGRYLGEAGEKRRDADLQVWYGQASTSWIDPIFGVQGEEDIKYVDSDGDGFITADDTLAVSRFFGRTHALVPTQLPLSKHEIRLEGDFFVDPGEEVTLDLLIGDEQNPVTDLHGFTFDLNFNPLFFDQKSTSIEFSDNSWLTYNAPVLTMYRNNGMGKLEAGFSRTSGAPAAGYGKVGRSKVVVTVDIIGVTPPDSDGNIQIPVEGGWATAISSSGQQFGMRVAPFTFTVRTKPDAPESSDTPKTLEKLLLIFPNPSTDFVQLYLPGQKPMEHIEVFSSTGQLVFDSGVIGTQQFAIPVSDLTTGMYFVRVRADEEVITRKFEVQH